MKRSTKRTVGWGSGAGIGVTFVVLTFVIITAVQNGGMKNLHGEDLVQLSQLDPAAGDEDYVAGDVKKSGTLDKMGAHLGDGGVVVKNGKRYVKHGDHWHEAELEYTEERDAPTDCGVYHDWVSYKVDEAAIKATGKKYRILKPGQAMTMDHNPERINVYINNDGYVLSVRCG